MKDRSSISMAAPKAAVSTLERRIAAVRNKMIGVVLIIVSLAVWQRQFVMEGIGAHLEMTLTILGTFVFSMALAFVFVAKLNNEVVAFKALREMWDDIQQDAQRSAEDPNWRLARCHQPARVFQRPRLLGHAYELVTEELARTKKIRVSVETMNTLVHTVEASINDEKSLISYLSGLLVFMGLIGTFIGLLQMVSSIGGIIGSLAGSTSGGDSTGAFGQLLTALQEPLKGMATGFATSLFGLFSSLVVGLLGRFAAQAAGILKGEFEAWLAGVVQIGGEREEDRENNQEEKVAISGRALQDPAMLRMVGNILGDYTRVAGQFDQTGKVLQSLQATQSRQTELIETLADKVGRIEAGHADLAASLNRFAAEQDGSLARHMDALTRQLMAGIGAEQAALREALAGISRQNGENLRLLTSSQHQTTLRLSEAIEMVSGDVARRAEAEASRIEAARASGASAFEAASRAIAGLDAKQSSRLSVLEQDLARLAAGQEALTRTLAEELPRLATAAAQEGDAGLSDGLSRINQTVDAALTAYSGLLHVALAALERADKRGGHSAETPGTPMPRTGTDR